LARDVSRPRNGSRYRSRGAPPRAPTTRRPKRLFRSKTFIPMPVRRRRPRIGSQVHVISGALAGKFGFYSGDAAPGCMCPCSCSARSARSFLLKAAPRSRLFFVEETLAHTLQPQPLRAWPLQCSLVNYSQGMLCWTTEGRRYVSALMSTPAQPCWLSGAWRPSLRDLNHKGAC